MTAVHSTKAPLCRASSLAICFADPMADKSAALQKPKRPRGVIQRSFVMPIFLRSFLILSLAALARGQTTVPSASPNPAGHSPHDPVMLEQFLTTASPFSRSQIEVAQSTTVLNGRSLLLKQQATLGDMLAGEVGM